MKHSTAYLHTTKDVGLIYHARQPSYFPTFQLQFASDYGHGLFADGFGTLGSIPALTTHYEEVKSYITQIKSALYLISVANITGIPQDSPNLI